MKFRQAIDPIAEDVLDFAVGKAQSVVSDYPESVVVGSDTMILINATKIGKPDDIGDARQILRLLSGKTHRIFTSVAILDEAKRTGSPDRRGGLCQDA